MSEGGITPDNLFQKAASWVAKKIAPGGFPTVPETGEQFYPDPSPSDPKLETHKYPTILDRETFISTDRLLRIDRAMARIDSSESSQVMSSWIQMIKEDIFKLVQQRQVNIHVRKYLGFPSAGNREFRQNIAGDTRTLNPEMVKHQGPEEEKITTTWEYIQNTAKETNYILARDSLRRKSPGRYPESTKKIIQTYNRIQRHTNEFSRKLLAKVNLLKENPREDFETIITRGSKGLLAFLQSGRYQSLLDTQSEGIVSFSPSTVKQLSEIQPSTIASHTFKEGLASRWATEVEMGIYDPQGETYRDPHPAYGLFTNLDRIMLHPEHARDYGYGEAIIVLKQENITSRTKFSIGDSVNTRERGKKYPQITREDAYIAATIIDTLQHEQNVDADTVIGQAHTGYVEAEILGGLTISDVRTIIIPNNEKYRAVLDFAQSLGVFQIQSHGEKYIKLTPNT